MTLTPSTGDEMFGCKQILFGAPFSGLPPLVFGQASSCTAFSPGTNTNDSHFVPAPGTVTKVRVKSGPNPAPIKITIIKQIFQTNPNPPHQVTDFQCCTGTGRESGVLQPQPNAISEFEVNLPVTTTPSINGASGHSDIVSVSLVGPGDLPLASVGADHSPTAGSSTVPAMRMFLPKVEVGLQGGGLTDYPNFVLLMNYDWTDGCAATAKVKTSACAPAGGGGGGAAVAPASVTSKSLRLKKGKVAIKINCTAAAGQACKGSLRLSTAAKKPKLLAKKGLNIKGGESKTIRMKLSSKARKRLKKKKNKVQVEIDLGAAGKSSKALILKK